jgi:activating signal cointegrator complex subunit 2
VRALADAAPLPPARHFAASGDKLAARDAAYKSQNKARFGNHNRKRGADKKLARAGGLNLA